MPAQPCPPARSGQGIEEIHENGSDADGGQQHPAILYMPIHSHRQSLSQGIKNSLHWIERAAIREIPKDTA